LNGAVMHYKVIHDPEVLKIMMKNIEKIQMMGGGKME
jgi:hypothetical protein